ncbi:MAG: metalloregulator ArsR/SmtB family transcription factor [Dehalococcoidia bacterium]
MQATRHTEAVQIASALADPLRMAILHRLMEGPAAVTDIVEATCESQSKVSNHLAILRARGLVTARRAGRQMEYRLRNPSVAQVVESLVALSGPSKARPAPEAPMTRARTCYDHLAGKLAVAILDALVARGALRSPDATSGDLALGQEAGPVFSSLGVGVDQPVKGRRRRAFACLDWTERRPHLGGALGAALLQRALAAGWVTREAGSRTAHVTTKGRRALKRLLGVVPA